MNTPGSVLLGWVVLIAAGGGAFYYAKKDINARRRAQELNKTRPPEKLEWWQRVEVDEKTNMPKNSSDKASGSGNTTKTGSSNGNGT